MAKRYALYVMRPGDEAARLLSNYQYASAAAARGRRRTLCRKLGPHYFVHAGDSHPDPLPKGEMLWAEGSLGPNK